LKTGRVKLLVAALEAELVAFPPELPGFDRLVTGPGKLQATYALTRALDAHRYDEILVVGTAGAIDARLDGDVYEIAAAIQHDVTDIDGIVGQHVSLPPRVELGRDRPRENAVTIATGDHFVDDAEAVAVIRPLGAGLVDMETYAYAWVAAQFGVPIRVIKAVSDRAQDDAITDWRTAVTACSAQLREFVLAEYGV
jgi:adenosylhomocysteine nucleosidase